MKSDFFSQKPSKPELERLQAELSRARSELHLAYQHLDLAADPELVEACIYQISAETARCNYLIRMIKRAQRFAVTEVSAAWT